MSTVIAFRPRRSTCRCGYQFIPLRPEHRLCRECYRWAKIGLLIDATRMQFQAMRESR